jgi:hypothetical protein
MDFISQASKCLVRYMREGRKCSLSGVEKEDCNSITMNVQYMIQSVNKCVLKIERLTSDTVTFCCIGESSRVVI